MWKNPTSIQKTLKHHSKCKSVKQLHLPHTGSLAHIIIGKQYFYYTIFCFPFCYPIWKGVRIIFRKIMLCLNSWVCITYILYSCTIYAHIAGSANGKTSDKSATTSATCFEHWPISKSTSVLQSIVHKCQHDATFLQPNKTKNPPAQPITSHRASSPVSSRH